MGKRSEAELKADAQLFDEAIAFSTLNDGAPVHAYSVKLADGKTELAYVADTLLAEGKSLLARLRAYHERKDKDGFRLYAGNVIQTEGWQTIGKAKAAKAAKAAPVLIAAKTTKTTGGKKK